MKHIDSEEITRMLNITEGEFTKILILGCWMKKENKAVDRWFKGVQNAWNNMEATYDELK